MLKKRKNKYVSLGITLISVLAVSAVIVAIIFNLRAVLSALGVFVTIISPVIYGIAFAYLMNPVMKVAEKAMLKLCTRKNMAERKAKKLSRTIGVISAVVVFALVLYALIATIVPEVVRSLKDLLNKDSIDGAYNQITEWLNSVVRGTPLESWLNDILIKVSDWLLNAINIDFLSNAATQVFGVAKGLFNAIIGVVVAIYMLISKDKFQAQAKKITVATFRADHADRILELARRTNKIFGGFIVGKIIDSSIIGVLCYIGTLIMNTPYAMLVSVIVGVSNVIPFFGPLVGGSVGVLLILLQDPLQALYFAIFVLALQQVDGNIIGPRILGDRLGISDFWILVSITVFGGLFGFAGMLLGVPVFTLLYSLIKDGVNRSLQRKKHTVDTNAYYSITAVTDLNRYRQEFGEPTAVYSEDGFESEFDPDDDIEYDEREDFSDPDDEPEPPGKSSAK